MRAAGTIRLALFCCAALPALWPGGRAGAQPSNEPVVLDSVVAVVNNHAILASDVESAMRLSVLEPPESAGSKPDRKAALDELISRELIEEQMTPEEKNAAEPAAKELKVQMALLREDLPACARYHCATDRGWTAFLAAKGLTEDQAEAYLRLRLSLLSFVENRFSEGIRISPEEIESYYRETMVPQYAAGEAPPALKSVSSRIEEILLEQQVNQLFSAWLDNLRRQGDVEILDSTLVPANQPARTGGDQ
ncbi:MAG: peptidylprolyl isomerase [Terracidiphilus sp.]